MRGMGAQAEGRQGGRLSGAPVQGQVPDNLGDLR